jgi:hypothetical protein
MKPRAGGGIRLRAEGGVGISLREKQEEWNRLDEGSHENGESVEEGAESPIDGQHAGVDAPDVKEDQSPERENRQKRPVLPRNRQHGTGVRGHPRPLRMKGVANDHHALANSFQETRLTSAPDARLPRKTVIRKRCGPRATANGHTDRGARNVCTPTFQHPSNMQGQYLQRSQDDPTTIRPLPCSCKRARLPAAYRSHGYRGHCPNTGLPGNQGSRCGS